jgi:hypothetical protein
MAIINKTGITDGSTIQAEHVTRAIDALSGGSTDTIIATGSFSGSVVGSLAGTASFAVSASRAISSSFATTASYAMNAGGSGINKMPLQFTHGTWVTASGTPHYYGNYGSSEPFSSINRIGVISPYSGTLVSASISVHNANPGGSTSLRFWAVKDGKTTPVSKSIATGISTDEYFAGANYVLDPMDISPFAVNVGDMLSIKIQSDATVNGLESNSTVTLIFQV